MKLTPHLLIAASLLSTTAIPVTTAFAPTSASALLTSSLILSGSSAQVLASSDSIPATKRNFRIGHPAVHANSNSNSNPQRYLSSSSSSTTMSSSAASLPSQDDAFPGFSSTPHLAPSPLTAERIADAMDLFCAKPSPAIFARSWSPDAIFADAICHATGAKQYLAQWYGMPATFSESRTLVWKLLKDSPTEIKYAQKQHYKVKGLGTTKQMVSTVVMHLDAQGKVVSFEDRWNHKPMGGAISWPFRRLNALAMPWIVGVPKEAKQGVQH